MSAVVADTHALICYPLEPSKLSVGAYNAMAAAEASSIIYVPAIVLFQGPELAQSHPASRRVSDD